MTAPPITLLTDFGYEDAYVAQMKGEILSICPTTQLIDITHSIAPQDITQAALVLYQAAPYFPAGTIHLAIVDPGVGTKRRMLALELDLPSEQNEPWRRQRFVLPDNGLAGPLLAIGRNAVSSVLTERRFWRSHISSTFHGRDIMGPVAAQWASGIDREQFGPRADKIEQQSWPQASLERDQARGQILTLDHFGNAITNVPATWLMGVSCQNVVVSVARRIIPFQQTSTYGDMPLKTPVLLVGSHQLVELAVVGGNAGRELNISRGDEVHIRLG